MDFNPPKRRTTATITTTTTTAASPAAMTAVSSTAALMAAGMEPRYLPPSHCENSGSQSAVARRPSADASSELGWPQRVLGEVKDMLLLLGPDGRTLYASPSCQWVTGYEAAQMEQQPISRFIHDEDRAFFATELDECIAVPQPLHCYFRFYKRDNTSCVLEAYGHPHMATPRAGIGNEKQSQVCNGVFLMCRPYPTRSSQLLDSFLEHKMENIRLHQRIAQLKEEEEVDLNAAKHPTAGHPIATATHTLRSPFITAGSEDEDDSSDEPMMADESESRSFLEPVAEDMSHIQGIEVMTGLYYGDGERSQGLSTGLRQGRLIHCNMEPGPSDQPMRDVPDGDRRKRLKGEYMCTDCGTVDSPEWRKGPEGPKTLCNACGFEFYSALRALFDTPPHIPIYILHF
ncbi:hypothetical protein EYZ11_001450 [Aspergillus tanneri]|uniref:Blue light receptor n=1 Tax=Aspergillus tanneri TaxID=1220188 RepID=A0A4S3JUI8_9EURO|nr:hypothetical protein EYZ11_001450 [Aspergillus tanneri]